jgi:phosphoglycolate phosphatase-like HAD superfamily hydrolase
LLDNKHPYVGRAVVDDVLASIHSVHVSGELHRAVVADISKYAHYDFIGQLTASNFTRRTLITTLPHISAAAPVLLAPTHTHAHAQCTKDCNQLMQERTVDVYIMNAQHSRTHCVTLLCTRTHTTVMLYMYTYHRYLLPSPDLKAILQRLRDSGKQLFICSNSPWYFVDAGMRHLMGPDWVRTSKRLLTVLVN